jgi:hypothetical protein
LTATSDYALGNPLLAKLSALANWAEKEFLGLLSLGLDLARTELNAAFRWASQFPFFALAFRLFTPPVAMSFLIRHVQFGPFNFNYGGFHVRVRPITINLYADTGPGKPLGNLLFFLATRGKDLFPVPKPPPKPPPPDPGLYLALMMPHPSPPAPAPVAVTRPRYTMTGFSFSGGGGGDGGAPFEADARPKRKETGAGSGDDEAILPDDTPIPSVLPDIGLPGDEESPAPEADLSVRALGAGSASVHVPGKGADAMSRPRSLVTVAVVGRLRHPHLWRLDELTICETGPGCSSPVTLVVSSKAVPQAARPASARLEAPTGVEGGADRLWPEWLPLSPDAAASREDMVGHAAVGSGDIFLAASHPYLGMAAFLMLYVPAGLWPAGSQAVCQRRGSMDPGVSRGDGRQGHRD